MEPFTEPARRAMIRAQEVAAMFGSSAIGTEHIAFGLAEGDDALAAVLAGAIDRERLRERLGTVSAPPTLEAEFTPGAKHTIEQAFANARRHGHQHIALEHLALGMLSTDDPPALRAGVAPEDVRASIDALLAGHSERKEPR